MPLLEALFGLDERSVDKRNEDERDIDAINIGERCADRRHALCNITPFEGLLP